MNNNIKNSNKHKLIYENGVPYPTENELMNIFASSCIESCAKSLGCSSKDMYSRMKAVNLFNDYIYPCYDTLHTEGRSNVTLLIIDKLKKLEKNE